MAQAWRSGAMRSTAWRDAVNPLKQEARLHGSAPYNSVLKTLEELSNQPNSTAVKDNEVSEDFAFLTQQLVQTGSQARHNSGRAEVIFCRLLVQVLSNRRVRLSVAAANIISAALRRWCDGSVQQAQQQHEEEGEGVEDASGDMQLQCEAVQAMGAVMMRDNLAQVSSTERAAVLAALISLAHTPPSLLPPQQSGEYGHQRVRPPAELQRQAVLALGHCCGEAGSCALSMDELGGLLKCVVAVLQESCIGVGRVVEDAAHSRFYAALTKTTHQLVVESKRSWVPHAATLVECLRKFFLYCVPSSPQTAPLLSLPLANKASLFSRAPAPEPQLQWATTAPAVSIPPPAAGGAGALPPSAAGAAAATATGAPASGASPEPAAAAAAAAQTTTSGYRPPHLRAAAAAAAPAAPSPTASTSSSLVVPWRRASTGVNEDAASTSAAPEMSQTEAAQDKFRSSRVRLAVLQCLQVMAKSDPQGLHLHWSSILPVQQPLHPRPLSPNLVTVLLFDPLPKIRTIAAATISAVVEGPAQRSLLSVAEAKQAITKPAWSLTLPSATSASGTAPSGSAKHSRPLEGIRSVGIRSFTSLSSSLGQIVQCVHQGLLVGVIGEATTSVLSVVLHALRALISVAPFDRLPQTMLPEVIQAVQMRWAALQSSSSLSATELSPLHAACFACVAEAWATKAPLPGMASYLQLDAQVPASSSQALISSLTEGATHPQVVVRMEALAALKGLATLYHTAAAATFGAATQSQPSVAGSHPISSTRQGSSAGGVSVLWWHAILAATKLNLDEATRADLAARGKCTSSTSPRGWLPGSSSGGSRSNIFKAPHAGVGADARPPLGSAVAAAAAESLAVVNTIQSEDKAAQLSVQLLGSYLSSHCQAQGFVLAKGEAGVDGDEAAMAVAAAAREIPSHADMEAVALILRMWKEALEVLLPAASHTAYMVRSAAMTAFYELPEPLFVALGPAAHESLGLMLVRAVTVDPVAAVRASACKVLGRIASYSPISKRINLLQACPGDASSLAMQAVAAIASSIKDAVMSVRMTSSWALATLCEAQRHSHELVDHSLQDLGPPDRSQPPLYAPSHEASAFPVEAGGDDGDAGQVAEAMPASNEGPFMLTSPLSQLAAAALVAVQDADKVRGNGVRALGALLTILPPACVGHAAAAAAAAAGREKEEEVWDVDCWLDAAVGCLQSCMTTGNMKVQWNACIATHGLLKNDALMANAKMAPRGAILLLLLVMLVRDSSNMKIRTHAAAALSAPHTRMVYGSVYVDALLVVTSALEGLEQGDEQGRDAWTHSDGSSGVASAAQSPAVAGGGGEEGDGGAHNYRYVTGLAHQLRRTLLHLLSLAENADAARLRDAAGRRVQFLRALLLSSTATELQSWRGEMMAVARRAREQDSAVRGLDSPEQLPADLFDTPDATPPASSSDALPATAAGVLLRSALTAPLATLTSRDARFSDTSVFVSAVHHQIDSLCADLSQLMSAHEGRSRAGGDVSEQGSSDTTQEGGLASAMQPARAGKQALDRLAASMGGLARLLQGAGARGASVSMAADSSGAADELKAIVTQVKGLLLL